MRRRTSSAGHLVFSSVLGLGFFAVPIPWQGRWTVLFDVAVKALTRDHPTAVGAYCLIVIAVGGFMVIRGTMSIGTLFAFYVFLDLLTHPMMDLPHLFSTGQQAFVSIDRVEEIRSFPIKISRTSGRTIDTIDALAFEGVEFSYGDDRTHLRDVSFRVPAGSRVAVVGPVASGKSTLLKLMAGILQPSRGKILVNGSSLESWDWDTYRVRLGYVPQEGVLFSKSIQENVLFGRTAPEDFEADDAWGERCLTVAQMNRDLPDLPKGWETVVGQKGSLVSGGQKQRIAIARALAGRPQLHLLDDCTAALDARNEDQFWTDLYEELPGCTCFIVSHRLGTIRRADHILVLEDGALIDEGSHEELALRCDTYREFLKTERRKAHLEAEAAGETETAGVT